MGSAEHPEFDFGLGQDDPRAAVVASLQQLYRGVPVSGLLTNAERLARTRAWVNENRPDADERMREVEAQYLAVMLEFFSGDLDLSVGNMKNLASLQVLDLWALDGDRDGVLSDEEIAAGGAQFKTDPVEHPLLRERFDTDGDGVISNDERTAAHEMMASASMDKMREVSADIMLRMADTDADGVVTPDERFEAIRSLGDEMAWLTGMVDSNHDGELTREEWDAMAHKKMADMEGFGGPEGWSMDDFADQMLASQFFQELELIPEREMLKAGMQAETPQFPGEAAFDTNGDGELQRDEREAYSLALQEHSERLQEWSGDWQERYMRMRFENAEGIVDTNGDGIASDQEWADAYPRLEAEREARLFQWMYDTDGSGSVGPAEADAFVRLAQQGHPRADLNLDGVVSREDIRLFTELFVEQAVGDTGP